jgi:TetR/AcrR family transcriptional regulator, lmrAB and yxaGH operons repressor
MLTYSVWEDQVARQSTTQLRMVEAGELLLSERGYGNVTMIEVIDKAEAPRGSIYYHFPGGKEDLATKVVAKVGQEAVHLVDWAAERSDSPRAFLLLLVERHRRRLEKSDFALGCPMMGIMVNVSTESETLRSAVADAFMNWITAVAQGLTSKGVPPAVARRAAATFVAGVEGAILVSRTTRSVAPFSLLADTVPGLLAPTESGA